MVALVSSKYYQMRKLTNTTDLIWCQFKSRFTSVFVTTHCINAIMVAQVRFFR